MLHNFIMSGSLIGSAEKFAKGGGVASKEIKKRLEEIRKELRAEKISYGELAELQSLKKYIDPSDVELLEAAGVPEKHEDGGGVAKGWTDADLMAKGGGVTNVTKNILKEYIFEYHYPKYKKQIAITQKYKVDVSKVIPIGGRGEDGFKLITLDGNDTGIVITLVNALQAIRKGEIEFEQIKDYFVKIKAIKNNEYAKGGGIKQKGSSDTSLDKLEKAKRVGYRFTDKKAKQLHLGANAKPTAEEIKKMKNGKGVYYENRKNRSDKSRMKKLEDGGVAEGWTDAELLEKGGAAKAKKKGGGNSGMMAKIQSGAKALRAEHPSMKWTDCIKKSAANLKAKGELHN